jgi:hypothetical protein
MPNTPTMNLPSSKPGDGWGYAKVTSNQTAVAGKIRTSGSAPIMPGMAAYVASQIGYQASDEELDAIIEGVNTQLSQLVNSNAPTPEGPYRELVDQLRQKSHDTHLFANNGQGQGQESQSSMKDALTGLLGAGAAQKAAKEAGHGILAAGTENDGRHYDVTGMQQSGKGLGGNMDKKPKHLQEAAFGGRDPFASMS